ncbi:unnamed protein product, partial [Mesorhabditis belari]|uniref:RNB domain-containing protein n=1 Tax=Mesorhabditis belari TaxID=2138241 RepID=A0AAF3F493_9BILA
MGIATGLFSPTDPRMPRMMLPADQLPANFFERPQDYQKFLFVAKMVDWASTAQLLAESLSDIWDLLVILTPRRRVCCFQITLTQREFSPLALSSLPITESSQWHIEEKEFKYRVDLRDELIFTIDPVTARDLDDALHIKPCADIDGKGTHGWEIGVHIADVTHFLLENSELDNWARERATSTYLVHKVIPMLPRLLCEELCSLNSGVDRLCFSVVWKMSEEGEIFDEKFTRTIIRSRCKLAYEHAQEMLENPDKEFAPDELPPISDGCTSTEISTKVQLFCGIWQRRLGQSGKITELCALINQS